MSSVEKHQQIVNNEQLKLKVVGTQQSLQTSRIFSIQLTSFQANAINKLLPKSFILTINKLKTKRNFKKNFSLQKKANKSVAERSEKSSESQKIQQHPQRAIQQINNNQMIKKFQKIFNGLCKAKCSWPFRDPVDPVALGIPHYKQIIKNPMDLRTIGLNISQNKYSTISQFYADIQLIINNSLTFNQNNPQFITLTSEFQKLFQKLKGEPQVNIGRPPIKKIITPPVPCNLNIERKKSQIRFIPDLKKRRQLTTKIKKLSRDQLSDLIKTLNHNQNNKQLNLQILPQQKIQVLQDYFTKRQLNQLTKPSMRAKQPMKKPIQKQQSSFESASDS